MRRALRAGIRGGLPSGASNLNYRSVIIDDLLYTVRLAIPDIPGGCESAALEAWDLATGARRSTDDILAWEDSVCDGPGWATTVGSRFVLTTGWGFSPGLFAAVRAYDRETGTPTVLPGAPFGAKAWTMDEAGARFFTNLGGSITASPLPGSASPAWSRSIRNDRDSLRP